jgi:hypothetical protein
MKKEKPDLNGVLFAFGILLMLAAGALMFLGNIAVGAASFVGGLVAMTAAKRNGQK